MVFNFWTLLLKLYIFWGCDIFSCLVVMQSTQFFSGTTYKICVSYEAFFLLTMRMPMITKLFRVMTCCKELSPIHIHDISTEWSSGVKWQIKYICHISNTYLQNMYRYHTTQGGRKKSTKTKMDSSNPSY